MAEGLLAASERITGRIIKRPKDTTPQKTPVPVDFLTEIPRHYDETRYEDLCDLVRIYTLLDTLVRAEELIAIRLNEYDRRSGTLRITHPKGGGSPGGAALAHHATARYPLSGPATSPRPAAGIRTR